MFKLNIRVLLAVSVALLILYSLVSTVSAEPARSLRVRPTNRSLRSTLEALTDPSKRQQQICQNFVCAFATEYFGCPDGCHSKFLDFFPKKNENQ